MSENYTKLITTIIIVGIIFVLGSYMFSSVETIPEEINQEQEYTDALFSSIHYNGEKELLIDCGYYSNGYCYVGIDSPKGWLIGPLHESSFEDFYNELEHSNVCEESNMLLIDKKMDSYYMDMNQEIIQQYIEDISDIVYNMSMITMNTAKESESIQNCMTDDSYTTMFMEPYFKNNEAVWKVGIGSPADPIEYVFVSFNGEELI